MENRRRGWRTKKYSGNKVRYVSDGLGRKMRSELNPDLRYENGKVLPPRKVNENDY